MGYGSTSLNQGQKVLRWWRGCSAVVARLWCVDKAIVKRHGRRAVRCGGGAGRSRWKRSRVAVLAHRGESFAFVRCVPALL